MSTSAVPKQIETAVIGAGHAGLAMSNLLTSSGIEHLVVDRAQVASSWRNERWDSFTLLTPNWATWLPGWHYRGDDPHGFMGRDEIVAYLTAYAESFAAPVHPGIDVRSLVPTSAGLRLSTISGEILARSVVIATGPFGPPRVPAWADDLPGDVMQMHSRDYRSTAQLPDGGVLVVGSGPSGQQIAEDLLRNGRRVALCVGRHRRVPRRYRGRDYYWWLELGGFYEKTAEDVPPAQRRDGVAPALTGFDGGHDLDLRRLAAEGVTLLGRATGASATRIEVDDSLARNLAEGDRAYDDFTAWVENRLYRFEGMFDEREPRPQHEEPPEPPSALDLAAEGIGTVVWATGFRPGFESWVDAPVLEDGRPVHDRGTTAVPGLYFLGQSWLHRLRSPFIRGAEEDARHLIGRITSRDRR